MRVRVRGYGRDEVSPHHRLGTAFADVYARKQINTHTQTRTRRVPGNEVEEDGCRGWLFLYFTRCVCVCVYEKEREREMHGVSFRTRSLSGMIM